MKTPRFGAALIALFLGLAASAADYYVATDGNDSNSGVLPESAFATIAKAISEATSGLDVIHVAAGSYSIASKGIFPQCAVTIEGTGDDTILNGPSGDATPFVYMETAGVTIRGFKIVKSGGNNSAVYLSAGTLENCWITGCRPRNSRVNTALRMAGGTLRGCRFSDNSGGNGQTATKKGDDAYYTSTSWISGNSVISNCLFYGNSTAVALKNCDSNAAGALFVCPGSGNAVTICNTTVVGNYGATTGGIQIGAPYCTCEGSVVIRDSVIAANRSPHDYAALGVGNSHSKDLTVCLANSGSVTFENTFIQRLPTDYAGTPGITVAAPGFVDEAAGNYALVAGSAAYGAGYNGTARGNAFSCAVTVPTVDRAIGSLTTTLEAQTFNAPEGAATYEWDLDGDGTYETTDKGASFAHTFTTPGWNKVGVKVTIGGEVAEQAAANIVYVAPERIYLAPAKNGVSGTAVFPYDTLLKSATTLAQAMKAAIPGSTIFVGAKNGTTYAAGGTAYDVIIDGNGYTGSSASVLSSSGHRFYNNVHVRNVELLGAREAGAFAMGMTGYDNCTISNCWITGGWYTTGGTPGGTYSAGLITDSLFTGNYCNGDSPIFAISGTVKVRNCVFTGNYFGGNALDHKGIVQVSGTAEFVNNVVYGNYGVANGEKASYCSGIWVPSGTPVIRNCVVAGNMKDGNLSAGVEANWYISGGTPTIENCYTPDAPAGATGSVADGTPTDDFTDPDNGTAASRDFSLKEDSKCIGAGLAQSWMKGSVDFAGNARFQGFAADIGAYEFAEPTPALRITASPTVHTGAAEVTFTAVNDTAEAPLPNDTVYTWKLNGDVVAGETGATFTKMLDTGKYTAEVEVLAVLGALAEDIVWIKQEAGAEFTATPTQKAGFARVAFATSAVGGVEFDEAATYTWFSKPDGGDDWTQIATGKNAANVRFETGDWRIKLVVGNYDGEGGELVKEHVEPDFTVAAAGVNLAFSKTDGEKFAAGSVTPTVTGFSVADGATYSWYWNTPDKVAPDAIGNPANYRIPEGVTNVYLKITGADDENTEILLRQECAFDITPGADWYVKSTGNDETNAGDGPDQPFKTPYRAIQAANDSGKKRIKVLGTVQETHAVTLDLTGIELYGDGWSKAVLNGQNNGSTPNVKIGAGGLVHGIKFDNWRTMSGLSMKDDTACVSNCWMNNLYYSTGGYNAGNHSAGLLTHCLITGCYNNNSDTFAKNGPSALNLTGTAIMRNCVFTGNHVGGNGAHAENLFGSLTMSGNAVMENCVIYDNYTAADAAWNAEDPGCYSGGIYVRSGSPVIRNCIIRNNKTSEPGTTKSHTREADVFVATGATPTIVNCNLPEGQVPSGEGVTVVGCQTGDPLFVDATNATAANRDFSIGAASPCRDAGRGNSLKIHRSGATDYKGNPRVMGRKIDIGACEYEEDFTPTGTMFLVR